METIIANLIENKYPFIIILTDSDSNNRITCSHATRCEFVFHMFRYKSDTEKNNRGLIIFTKDKNRTNLLRSFGIAFAFMNGNKYFLFHNGNDCKFVNQEDYSEIPINVDITNENLNKLYAEIGVDFNFKKINSTEIDSYLQYKKFQDLTIPTSVAMRTVLHGFRNILYSSPDNVELLKDAARYLE